MFSTFDLCLLLYVIRLAGWLKHLSLPLVCRASYQQYECAEKRSDLRDPQCERTDPLLHFLQVVLVPHCNV